MKKSLFVIMAVCMFAANVNAAQKTPTSTSSTNSSQTSSANGDMKDKCPLPPKGERPQPPQDGQMREHHKPPMGNCPPLHHHHHQDQNQGQSTSSN